MSHNFEDNSVNNLLKDIDDLMNRIGDRSQISDQHSQRDNLRQTGRFNFSIDQQTYNENEMPKKFHTSIPKKQFHTPKKVQIQSSSSSSSSDEEYYKKKVKKTASVQKFAKPTNQSIKSGSKLSYCSHQFPNLIGACPSIQQQPIVQPPKDAFCLICEEFIPMDIVNIHMNECQTQQHQLDNQKLKNYQKLLSLRIQGNYDDETKNLIQLLYNCTQQIIDASDQYQLSQILEDLCIIKTSLTQNTQAYHVLTVAQKIQEIATRKIQFLGNPFEPQLNKHQDKAPFVQQQQDIERQTVISYATDRTARKRLFEQPSQPTFPKQLFQFKKPPLPAKKDFQSPSPQKQPQKNGIEYGNNFDSSKKREYIQLSNSKTHSRIPTYQFEEQNEAPSVISKVQSYFTSVKDKFTSKVSEDHKKRFFNLGCRLKDAYPVNHPAQKILVSEMYNQCQRQQIPEPEWSVWISNILQNA